MQKAVPLAGERQKSCTSGESYNQRETQWSLLKTWIKLTLMSPTKLLSFPSLQWISHYVTGWMCLINKCRESGIPSNPQVSYHCWRESTAVLRPCTAQGTLRSHLCGTAHKKANTFLCCLAKPLLTPEQLLKLQSLNWLMKTSLGTATSSLSLPSSLKQMVAVIPSLQSFPKWLCSCGFPESWHRLWEMQLHFRGCAEHFLHCIWKAFWESEGINQFYMYHSLPLKIRAPCTLLKPPGALSVPGVDHSEMRTCHSIVY